ncbi:diguanylate cyclase domain-containing protein [Dactylosporangium maewongense]|uniref:diguanylate cyclase domain-containing protein n=1 Tax=Dactylosporangium maewongense TaxID=634393 RepID=UPI003CD058F5
MVDGHPLRARASIGIFVSGPDSTPCQLLRQADQAMYSAKRRRTGRSDVHLTTTT